jgi:hypothetical protein
MGICFYKNLKSICAHTGIHKSEALNGITSEDPFLLSVLAQIRQSDGSGEDIRNDFDKAVLDLSQAE